MKKGFTLIELLAVIVILAIIAVIAVPIVLNIINDSKKNSILRSAELYLKSVEFSISNELLNKIKFQDGTYPIMEDGNICIGIIEEKKCNGKVIKVELKGSKPNNGKINIKNNSKIEIEYLEIDGYNYYKENDKYVCDKEKMRSTFYKNDIEIDASNKSALLDYKIYGNLDGVGDKTDNLLETPKKMQRTAYANCELIDNGFKAKTTTLKGGYDSYTSISLLDIVDIKWGNTYTVTCNVKQSIQGMNSLMRIGYFKNTTNTWKDFKGKTIQESNIYSVTFTLPEEKPEDFGQLSYGTNFLQLFFNIQRDVLEEYGSITVTDIMLTEGDIVKEYEPYGYKIPINVNSNNITNIYLKEPLRKIDEYADYIDFKNQKVFRYIEELEDGTLNILKTPKEENIELPSILISEGVNNISINTKIVPSKVELEYYK